MSDPSRLTRDPMARRHPGLMSNAARRPSSSESGVDRSASQYPMNANRRSAPLPHGFRLAAVPVEAEHHDPFGVADPERLEDPQRAVSTSIVDETEARTGARLEEGEGQGPPLP